MKKLFSFISMFCMSMIVFAQNTLVATLTHGNEISMYYGAYALQQANRAAQSGDVIHLSGGSFQASNITKGISLRGTGIDDVNPTYIIGGFEINIPSSDTCRLTMEGIYCYNGVTMRGTFNSPLFTKNLFTQITFTSTSTIKNALFANCKILRGNTNGTATTVQFINSYVSQIPVSDNSAAAFVNCVIDSKYDSFTGFAAHHMRNSNFLSCIFYTQECYSLPSSSTATNCVSIGCSDFFSGNPTNKGNTCLGKNEFEQLFKNFTGTYSRDQKFELCDEAKTKYLGTDGTEVGMHGGPLPYSSIPSYPRITKMNVANKATADGKLSVEIEVSAAE